MKLSDQEKVRLCQGLSLLLHGGVSLSDGLFLLAEEEQGDFQALLKELGASMDQGADLVQAMENSGAIPELILGFCRIGQESGRLEEALTDLAGYYEEQIHRKRQIRSAVAYPSVILLLMLTVIAVLLVKVLPIFAGVYASLGSRMSGAAGVLLYAGEILQWALPLLFLILLAVVFMGLLYRYNRGVHENMNRVLLSHFGDRGLAKQFNNAQFTRGLAMGLASGLMLEEAMELSQKLLSHIPAAKERCTVCLERLQAGEDLAKALDEADFLPVHESRLLTLGLRSGSGEQIMKDIAERLSEDASQSLEDFVSKIEPAMVLICSALVGLILLSVMLPLMDIMSVLG